MEFLSSFSLYILFSDSLSLFLVGGKSSHHSINAKWKPNRWLQIEPLTPTVLVHTTLSIHCKYVQWNYSEDTTKNCKTELQFFYCNMDKYFAIHSTMQKCRFKFTVITLHLEQQSNVKNTVKNCKLDYSYSTVLCTFLSCVPYLQCIGNCFLVRMYAKSNV